MDYTKFSSGRRILGGRKLLVCVHIVVAMPPSLILWLGKIDESRNSNRRGPLHPLTRSISFSLLEFQHGAFASKNIRAPEENACIAGYQTILLLLLLLLLLIIIIIIIISPLHHNNTMLLILQNAHHQLLPVRTTFLVNLKICLIECKKGVIGTLVRQIVSSTCQ